MELLSSESFICILPSIAFAPAIVLENRPALGAGLSRFNFDKSVYNASAMRLRLMTEADIPAGMRLKEIAGWNQTCEDWRRFLEASPSGCFVAEVDGKVCGTATTIVYQNRFAWVGMVLVDPEYRSRGFGTQLLEKAIRHLDERQIATIKLDATPQGKPIYEKLGFVREYELERWTLLRIAADAKGGDCGPCESVSPKLLESVLWKDQEIFGASRSFLLKSLHRHSPHLSITTSTNGELEGYAFGRRGSFADHLGPWVATNADAARRCLETFLTRSGRNAIIVDRLKANTTAEGLLRSLAFTYARPLTRMVRGPNKYAGQIDILCAVVGPEFG
jgi:GNAT superfamily N-acetyltransferase